MSTLMFGMVTRKRDEAKSGESVSTAPPGVAPYADALTALVPAEVLVVFAVLLPHFATVETSDSVPTVEAVVVTVTNLAAARITFWTLIVMSAVLYLVGRFFGGEDKAPKFERADFARMLIPPVAFIGWVMLQQPVLLAATGVNLSSGVRTVVAVIGAMFLGAIATVLGYKANMAEATGRKVANDNT